MKIWSLVLSALMALSFGLAATSSEAARLGGGKSSGKQSSNVTQREAAKPATPATPPAAIPSAAPKKPWGAMLGGLAAGLGLAWLASSLGLGGAMANIMMFALLAVVAVVVIGFVMRKMKGGNAAQGQSPFAMQGVGSAATPRSTARKMSATTHRLGLGSAVLWRLTPVKLRALAQ